MGVTLLPELALAGRHPDLELRPVTAEGAAAPGLGRDAAPRAHARPRPGRCSTCSKRSASASAAASS